MALVLHQPNNFFLPPPTAEYVHASVSLHSFSLKKILTGKNFELSGANVGGGESRWEKVENGESQGDL